MAYELFIANRYLRSKQTKGFISVIAFIAASGVVLGVAALIIMLSVTNGFSGEVKNRLIGMNAHISIMPSYGNLLQEWSKVVLLIREFPEVVAASPVIQSKVGITAKSNSQFTLDGTILWGIDPGTFGGVSDLPDHLKYDAEKKLLLGPLPEEKFPGIILGEHLARRLLVGPGDEVLLMTLNDVEMEDVMMGITPRLEGFVVTDTFESGMFHYDDNQAFVSLDDAQRILSLDDESTTNIHVRITDVDRAMEVSEGVADALGSAYRVTNWTFLFPQLFRWIELEKWVIFIALSLIIVVAAFNIMSILVLSIFMKTPEIGILRTMGSTTRGIRRIFVYQGLAIGIVGTALGCCIGLVICLLQQQFQLISIPGDIYVISSLPVDMQLFDFFLVSVVSLAICLVASLYPARRAAALMPVDAIRYVM